MRAAREYREPPKKRRCCSSDLKVTRPPNTYLLLISYRSPNPRLAADVANAIARSYLEHTYNIRFKSSASLSAFMERQLEELKAKMERSGAALAQFERELNVINPEEKTSILSARLLQLNTEYTNAQADRVRKEAAYKSVAAGTLEAAQVSTQGDRSRGSPSGWTSSSRSSPKSRLTSGRTIPNTAKRRVQLAELQRQMQQPRRTSAIAWKWNIAKRSTAKAMLQQSSRRDESGVRHA